MKTLPEDMRAALDSGTTTLAWCWRIRRRDGVVLGFTDHDRDLVFDGTTFEAATGFDASAIDTSVGLGVDNLEVGGALSSDRLSEADLAAGFYDDAAVEIFRVDWVDPNNRVLMRSGSLGEVSRAGKGFKAEVRGLAHYLQQTHGRVYQYTCDADLGDSRCKVDLSASAYQGTGFATSFISARRFEASGLNSFASGFFSRGVVEFSSGPAAGQKVEVKSHSKRNGVVTLECWAPVRKPLTAGAAIRVSAGCDKTLATCRAKFSNAVNYRGFPHMPGNDFVASHAKRPGARR